ncbi:MAG: acetyl-CoA carboxylase biotin carboxyl carrier protein subunit [Bacteroidales bacterium]|nr:acetyl-CoA carboxylase biotin carboxyl carrier protein subunit [Bacteroidales bacterium]
MDKLHKIKLEDTVYETRITAKYAKRKAYQEKNEKLIYSVIPGQIVDVFVKSGDKIEIGMPILILEAMKMNNIVTSEQNAIVKEVKVKIGDKIAKGTVMLELE